MAEYIDKQSAIADLNKTYDKMAGFHPQFYSGYQFAVSKLRAFPAAEVEPVRYGDWIEPSEEESDWRCSICGGHACICVCGKDRTKHMPFCPNCGARMDLGGADNGE